MRLIEMTPKEMLAAPRGCGWYGCDRSYKGDMPDKWTVLLVLPGMVIAPGKVGEPVLLNQENLMAAHHDKVLCPYHSRKLNEFLHVGPSGALRELAED